MCVASSTYIRETTNMCRKYAIKTFSKYEKSGLNKSVKVIRSTCGHESTLNDRHVWLHSRLLKYHANQEL